MQAADGRPDKRWRPGEALGCGGRAADQNAKPGNAMSTLAADATSAASAAAASSLLLLARTSIRSGNHRAAVSHLRQSASLGNADAHGELALFSLWRPRMFGIDAHEAVAAARRSLEAGSAIGAAAMSWMHRVGVAIDTNAEAVGGEPVSSMTTSVEAASIAVDAARAMELATESARAGEAWGLVSLIRDSLFVFSFRVLPAYRSGALGTCRSCFASLRCTCSMN